MTHLDQHNLACLEPFTVTYPSCGISLRGYLLQPEGSGPFPAVLFEHGSSGLLPSHIPGVKALQSMGYAVFVALRRGHHGNAGPNWLSLALLNPYDERCYWLAVSLLYFISTSEAYRPRGCSEGSEILNSVMMS